MQQQSQNISRWLKPYNLLIMCAGGLASAVAIYNLDTKTLDLRFFVVALLTLFVSSRIVIPIPRFSSQISVSDPFIYVALLLYGGPPAILLAGTEALLSSFRFSKKPYTILFNWGAAATSTAITSLIMTLCFGDIVTLNRAPFSPTFIVAIALMAVIQYLSISGFVAVCGGLKSGQPFWCIWRTYYLWTSVTYFAAASAAAIVSRLTNQVGFYALTITVPTVAIVYLTYRTYLKNIEAAAIQAEQAENHIRELSHYINEQSRIREQYTQMEKLSSLGELASGVAHDFNNTLAGILGRAQLLLKTSDPEKIERGLRIIIKTAEDGAQTVKRIQDFARQRRDHDFQPVSIAQILLDVSEITKPRWKDQAEANNIHISLHLRVHSKSCVMGDESELRDVLVNMVFNAIDAMPKGGNLILSVSDVGRSVMISVTDTGVGMTNDVRSRIFDPFFTTKGKGGMGLGLAVSFGIIRRHEGTIEVDSQVGYGSTFRIMLPMAIVPTAVKRQDAERLPSRLSNTDALPSMRRTSATILVVDDEDSVRDLLKEILEGEGCTVHTAADGHEALTLFDAHEFQAVFTDVGMPEMSGWELAQALRQRSRIPIAVITGWGDAVGSDDQREAGVDWVITKPFSADRIAELAREITNTHQANTATLSIVAA